LTNCICIPANSTQHRFKRYRFCSDGMPLSTWFSGAVHKGRHKTLRPPGDGCNRYPGFKWLWRP
jgi:hypothetical protein